jgi:hypothetical protein
MPRFDLAGNPMPDDVPPAPAPTQQSHYGVSIQPGYQEEPPQQDFRQPPSVYPYPNAPRPQNKPLTYFDGKEFKFTNPPKETPHEALTGWLVGIGMALAIGMLGSIGVMKLVFFIGLGFVYSYVLIGAAVGGSVVYGAKKGGIVTAAIAVGIMTFCLFVAHLVYVQDVVHANPADFPDPSLSAAFPAVMDQLNTIHWILVFASIGTAGRIGYGKG